MKRPILVAVIGYIIGIILGLYYKFSIAFLYGLLILIAVLIKSIKKHSQKKKFSFYSISRYLRYFKLILNRKTIIIIIIFSCLSNTLVLLKNKEYENFYKISSNVEIAAKVISNSQEKEYKNIYKIQVIEINKLKKDVFLYLNVDKKQELQYGDFVKIKGKYQAPGEQRNYGGFSYKDYLKTLNVYGTVTAEKVEITGKVNKNNIGALINRIQEAVKENSKKYLDKETSPIYLGLILGDTSYMEDDTKELFRNSNMSHILAVSGMHISYIVIGISIFLNKILGKKISKIITILVLLFYVVLTGFSPSIIRASSMVVIILLSGIFHKKADVWTSIAVSLFIILIYNPYLITNVGLQFSYMGTIGIILLNKNIMQILTRKQTKKYKQKNIFYRLKILRKIKEYKIWEKIKEIIAISISAQIFTLPLILFHFNNFGIYFLLTNLLVSLIIGPIIMFGFVFLILSLLNLSIVNILAIPLNPGIKVILFITNIGKFPLSKIYFRTPKIPEILIYYLIILILNLVYEGLTKKNPSNSNMRLKYMLELFKYNFKKHKEKCFKIALVLTFIISVFLILTPKKLKIHFVDVGQGDCCFIETPANNTILIDGGGSEFGSFDVGASTLLPYILDRGYTKIDYIFISHFDTDHVRWNINNIGRTRSRKSIHK